MLWLLSSSPPWCHSSKSVVVTSGHTLNLTTSANAPVPKRSGLAVRTMLISSNARRLFVGVNSGLKADWIVISEEVDPGGGEGARGELSLMSQSLLRTSRVVLTPMLSPKAAS